MKVRRLSRFKKGRAPLTYNTVAIDVTVEELEWLIRNHAKGKGHGICGDPLGKSVYSLVIVPSQGPCNLPEFT